MNVGISLADRCEFQQAHIDRLRAEIATLNRALQKVAGERGRSEQTVREQARENHQLRTRIERLEAALGSAGVEVPE